MQRMDKVVFPIEAIMYESESNDSDTIVSRPWRSWAIKCKSPHTLDWSPRQPRRSLCFNEQAHNGHLTLNDNIAISYGDDAEDGYDIKPIEGPLHDALQGPLQSRFEDPHPGRDIPPRRCVRELSFSPNRDTPPQLLQRVDSETFHRSLSGGSSSSLQ
jgi:hypothetical protein